MKEIKTVILSYEVEDNYGHTHTFKSVEEASAYEHFVQEERKILNYIKPKGVTLVISQDSSVYYKVIPGFIGYNGVPFCDALKNKGRESYYNGINTVERYSSIRGSLIQILSRAYKVCSSKCFHTFNVWDGAYHYHWDSAYGIETGETQPNLWRKGALWYNWDGEHFTTNDLNCKITAQDLLNLE